MKILIAHNQYLLEGGEDIVVQNETQLLKENGHHVKKFIVNNASISSLKQQLDTALNITYSKKSYSTFLLKLKEYQPDLVHVHNFFPLLSPSIYSACSESGIPVVQTLHNFRLICAGGLLLRNGKSCEKCVGTSPYWGVFHRCYQKSHLKTLPVAHMLHSHQKQGTWKNKVNAYITLSEFAKSKFVKGGLPENKIHIKPNFLPPFNTSIDNPNSPKDYVVFVGRLSEEKGIHTLMKAFQNTNRKLVIVGDGPLRKIVYGKNIQLLGKLSHQETLKVMASANHIVVPRSIGASTISLVIIEAFALKVPVVASNITGFSNVIQHGENGLLFEPGADKELKKISDQLFNDPILRAKLAESALTQYTNLYTKEQNYKLLMQIYKAAQA